MTMVSLLRTSINFHALRFNSIPKIVIVLVHGEDPFRTAIAYAVNTDLMLYAHHTNLSVLSLL